MVGGPLARSNMPTRLQRRLHRMQRQARRDRRRCTLQNATKNTQENLVAHRWMDGMAAACWRWQGRTLDSTRSEENNTGLVLQRRTLEKNEYSMDGKLIDPPHMQYQTLQHELMFDTTAVAATTTNHNGYKTKTT